MKKQISTLAITLITAISTWAYDFKVGELCYNITNYNEVEVTYEQTLDSWNEVPTYSSLSGSINIPREVNYNGSNYTVTNIGSFSFSYCTSITEIILPNSINNIEMNAFYKCTGLTEIILPNSVTNIGSSAFYGCSSLTEITIPNSVTSIEDNAFNNCSVLNAIYYLGQIEEWCNINFESDNSNPLFLAHNLYINNTLITEVTIPEGITEIKNYTFIGSSSLKQITLPNNLTHIGNETFRNCSALEQVSLPNSITSIGEKAFRNCSNLTQIILPSNITNIGLGAFQMSLALTSVYCEAITPPTLGDYAFADPIIFIPSGTKEAYITEWGSRFTFVESEGINLTINIETPGSLANEIINEGYTLTEINKLTVTGRFNIDDLNIIKNNMSNLCELDLSGVTNTTLPQGALSGTKLLTIILPDELTEIPSNAFEDCTHLTSVILPNSLTSIGNEAFSNCTVLAQIILPNNITDIRSNAFYGCYLLKEITLPNSITSIAESTFYNCSSLTQITLPNGITSIGRNAFTGCSSLEQITLPDNITDMGNYAFSYCESLKQITLPKNLTNLQANTFYQCDNLTSVTIGSHMENIDPNAFIFCYKIDTIISLNNNPPTVNSRFTTIDPNTCVLYVPHSAISNYRVAPIWGAFMNIEPIDIPSETYLLNLQISQGGKISYESNDYSGITYLEIEPETTTTLQILADPGYEISSITFNGEDYTGQISENGSISLPTLLSDATLEINFSQQIYTIAYYFEGSNGYFYTTSTYGQSFKCYAASTEGHTILSVTLNGIDITNQVGEDSLIAIDNITENYIIIISTNEESTTEIQSVKKKVPFRAWQSKGEIFVEHTQDMNRISIYDANGRLIHDIETNGYGIHRFPAQAKIHIIKASYINGTSQSVKTI